MFLPTSLRHGIDPFQFVRVVFFYIIHVSLGYYLVGARERDGDFLPALVPRRSHGECFIRLNTWPLCSRMVILFSTSASVFQYEGATSEGSRHDQHGRTEHVL